MRAVAERAAKLARPGETAIEMAMAGLNSCRVMTVIHARAQDLSLVLLIVVGGLPRRYVFLPAGMCTLL